MQFKEPSKSTGKLRVLAIASYGGHWRQLMMLETALSNYDTIYSTTVDLAEFNDCTRQIDNKIVDANFDTKIKMMVLFFQVAKLIIVKRPDIIITTGAAPGLIAVIIGRVLFKKSFWIDSIANAEKPSACGRIARKFSTYWYTQWEHIAVQLGTDYQGKLIQ